MSLREEMLLFLFHNAWNLPALQWQHRCWKGTSGRKACDLKPFSFYWYLHSAAFLLPVSWTHQGNYLFKVVSTLEQIISAGLLYQTYKLIISLLTLFTFMLSFVTLSRKLFPGYISASASLEAGRLSHLHYAVWSILYSVSEGGNCISPLHCLSKSSLNLNQPSQHSFHNNLDFLWC